MTLAVLMQSIEMIDRELLQPQQDLLNSLG